MEQFKEFLIKLFTQLSTGDFTVMVKCADDIYFEADVIGYSEEYMTIYVRFHADNLQKPGRKEVPYDNFGSNCVGNECIDTIMVDCMIPIKVENVYWESIKLK